MFVMLIEYSKQCYQCFSFHVFLFTVIYLLLNIDLLYTVKKYYVWDEKDFIESQN